MGYGRYKTGETIKIRVQARPTVTGGVAVKTSGLTDVIIDIHDNAGTQVVDNGAMSEVGSTGIYEYSYLPASQGTFTFIASSATNKLTYVESFIVGTESSGLAYIPPSQIEDTRMLDFIKKGSEFFSYMKKVEAEHESMFKKLFKSLKKIDVVLGEHKKTMDERHKVSTSKFSSMEQEQALSMSSLKVNMALLEKNYIHMSKDTKKTGDYFENQSKNIQTLITHAENKFADIEKTRNSIEVLKNEIETQISKELEGLKRKTEEQISKFSSEIKIEEQKFSEIADKAIITIFSKNKELLSKSEELLETKNNELRELVAKFSLLTKNMTFFTFQREAMENVLDQAYEKDRQISRLAATDIDKARESIEKNIENKHKEQKDKLNKLSGHIDDIDIELQLKTIGVTDATTDGPSGKRVSPSDFAHYFKASGLQSPARKEKAGNPSS